MNDGVVKLHDLVRCYLWSSFAHILNNAFSFLPALILEQLDPAILNRFIQGDLTALNALSPNAAVVFFFFSLTFSILLMGIFLSLVSLVWDWARSRSGRKQAAFISTTLNCLLPGLGQMYNGQIKKGQVLIGVFLIVSFTVATIFSLPVNFSSMEHIVNLGIGTLVVYLAIYGYAVIDAWIVGHRLDATTMKLHPGEATRINSRIKILREPAQLRGGIIGLLAGWAIALMIISNALLDKPLAIVAGIAGGMFIGWAVWFAIVKSLFQRRQVK